MIKKDCFYLQFDISLGVLALNNSQRKRNLIPIHSITRFRKHICKTNKKKPKNTVNKN